MIPGESFCPGCALAVLGLSKPAFVVLDTSPDPSVGSGVGSSPNTPAMNDAMAAMADVV